MSNLFTTRDPAGMAAGQLALGTAIGVSMLMDAHERGMAAVEEGRARRAAYEYDCALDAARARADDLGRAAINASRKVASLEAEVRRLTAALGQRQAYIDRMRGAK